MMRDEMAATKAQIDGTDDIATLIDWYDYADDMAESVKANIEARDLADVSDDSWFYRASDKFAYCKVAMNRIEKRLFRLGFDGRLGVDLASAADMKEMRRDIYGLRVRVSGLERGK